MFAWLSGFLGIFFFLFLEGEITGSKQLHKAPLVSTQNAFR